MSACKLSETAECDKIIVQPQLLASALATASSLCVGPRVNAGMRSATACCLPEGLHAHCLPLTQTAQLLSTKEECAAGQVPLNLEKDMYVHQFESFLKAVRTGDTSDLRCPYQTAAKTYQASQWITQARPMPQICMALAGSRMI